MGPLGRPLFGKRTLRRGAFGWDVSVLQFLLARRGELVPIDGFFDEQTERALRRFQRARHLAADGVAGTRTLASFTRRAPQAIRPVLVSAVTPATTVRALLDRWAAHYGVSKRLVRALAWMESGFQTNLTSEAGAWGVMQIIPSTWDFVQAVLAGQTFPRTAEGNIRVGLLYLRHLLRRFNGSERLALAGWYQGERAVREHGVYKESKWFAKVVLGLRRNGI
jgi:soluble lytic murein transglycosylase-like protein